MDAERLVDDVVLLPWRWDAQSMCLLELERNQLAGDSRRPQGVVPFMVLG